MSTTLTLTVPESLVQELNHLNQEFILDVLYRGMQAIKIERALSRYMRGNMSLGAAAEMAGVSQSELARHAYARGMEPPFRSETVAEELA